MIFLLCAVGISLTLTMVLKVSHLKGWDSGNITMINYGFAAAISLILCVSQGMLPAFSAIKNLDLTTVFSEKSVSGTMFFVFLLGFVTGTLYVVNIIFLNKNVRNNGAGISTLFSRSGFLISIAISIILFSETMTSLRWIGVISTIIALAVAGGIGGKTRLVQPIFLFGSLFCIGILDSNNKLYQSFALPEYMVNFTMVAFFSSSFLYFLLFMFKKRGTKIKFTRQEVIAGAIMGIPNAFGNIVQILALQSIPASIMFPTMAASNLLASTIISALVFKEPFHKRQAIAVALTTFSLILVNLQV